MTKKDKDTIQMTASTIGVDLLQALVLEVKLLPDVWPKLSKAKQDDVIERLRKRVVTCVQSAVHLIASDGRTTIVAELEQVTVKDGIKAVLTMSKSDPNRHGLIDAQGKTVLVAIADAEDHMGDVAAVRGEPDQRAMDLGREYDPKGDGNGMPGGQGDVVDAEVREVPALGNDALQAELDAAYTAGEAAAEAGEPKDSCPSMRHELVARWTQGWCDWHEENDAPSIATGDGGAAEVLDDQDELLGQAEQLVVSQQRASISFLQRQLRIGYNRAARLLEALEKAGVISAPEADGIRKVLRSGDPEAA
jgi:hypothetical protein